MAKVENINEVIADYKREYRRVAGKTCPNIEIKRAWISVGSVSFRPEGLVDALKTLKERPDFENHAADTKVNNDFVELKNIKEQLIAITGRLRGLQTINEDTTENTTDYIGKSIDEVDSIIEKNVMFE